MQSDRIVYVFFMSRPCDKGDAWPVVWTSHELAEKEPFRVSPVIEVSLSVKVPAYAA